MGFQRAEASARRFSKFIEGIVSVIGHADRTRPLRDYCIGLMMPCGRKSVEPMAAVTAPERVAAQHQSLLHFVNQSPWSDEQVLAKVREMVVPALERHGPIEAWIIDDTGVPKKGRHSVGVGRQYCGQVGKQDNCQVAVSLSIANRRASLHGRPERRFKTFMWTTRHTWSRRRRVVAKAEWTQGEANPRFVVTSLRRDECTAKYLYEKVYCARGEMENRIKECQLDLYADRTSAATMQANQLRLWFYSMAYVLLCALRRIGLHDTAFAKATCVHDVRWQLRTFHWIHLGSSRLIRTNSMFCDGISRGAWKVDLRQYGGRWRDKAPEPALEAIEIKINDRRGVEREQLA